MTDFYDNAANLQAALSDLFVVETEPCQANQRVRYSWAALMRSDSYKAVVRAYFEPKKPTTNGDTQPASIELPFYPKRSNNLVIINGLIDDRYYRSIEVDLTKGDHFVNGRAAVTFGIIGQLIVGRAGCL